MGKINKIAKRFENYLEKFTQYGERIQRWAPTAEQGLPQNPQEAYRLGFEHGRIGTIPTQQQSQQQLIDQNQPLPIQQSEQLAGTTIMLNKGSAEATQNVIGTIRGNLEILIKALQEQKIEQYFDMNSVNQAIRTMIQQKGGGNIQQLSVSIKNYIEKLRVYVLQFMNFIRPGVPFRLEHLLAISGGIGRIQYLKQEYKEHMTNIINKQVAALRAVHAPQTVQSREPVSSESTETRYEKTPGIEGKKINVGY